ncbi:RHS repeat domain-containing protein [Megalodesulfovibrio paquesii]
MWFDIGNRTFEYDAEDRLLRSGDTQYEYNADGFLTKKITTNATVAYTYSSRGETKTVDLGNGTVVEYRHDVLGRPAARLVNGEVTEKYLWLGRTRLLAIFDNNDNVLQRFLYADGRMPLAMEQAGETFYLAYDQVGSLRAVTDASGNVVKNVLYDSFGRVISDSNPELKVPFGFAGGLQDSDTGLVRFGYRDYDPETGRWTSKDPIGFDSDDANIYAYCSANPVRYVDANGQSAMAVVGPIAAAVAMMDTPVPGPMDAVAAVMVAVAALSDLVDSCPKECPPCDPPKGTRCWVKEYGPHNGHDPHWHVYEMQQIPATCECRWRYLGGKMDKGTFSYQPTNMSPCSSFAGFVGRK